MGALEQEPRQCRSAGLPAKYRYRYRYRQSIQMQSRRGYRRQSAAFTTAAESLPPLLMSLRDCSCTRRRQPATLGSRAFCCSSNSLRVGWRSSLKPLPPHALEAAGLSAAPAEAAQLLPARLGLRVGRCVSNLRRGRSQCRGSESPLQHCCRCCQCAHVRCWSSSTGYTRAKQSGVAAAGDAPWSEAAQLHICASLS